MITDPIAAHKKEIKRGKIFRHFKGDLYIVEDIAEDSESGQKLVIYRQLYGEGKLFARPLEMFASFVDAQKYPNADQEFRFQLQNIESKKH